MSGQMSDVIVIDDVEYSIVEPATHELFDARGYGISPVMMHTGNTRGVAASYRIDDGQLLLSNLQIGSVDTPPSIGGVEPTTDRHGQTWTYADLHMPITWTGDLIVGAGPILELFVHAGFLPAWHYEKVLALDIEHGTVESSEDRSEQVREFREARAASSEEGSNESSTDDEDDNVFERFLSSLKIRLGFDD